MISQPLLIDTLITLCNQFKCDKFKEAFLQRLVPAAIKPGSHLSASESGDSDTETGAVMELNVMLHKFLSEVTLDEGQDGLVIR